MQIISKDHPVFLGNIPNTASTIDLTNFLSKLVGSPVKVIKGKNRGKKIKRWAIIHCPTFEVQQSLLCQKEGLKYKDVILTLKIVIQSDSINQKELKSLQNKINIVGRLPDQFPIKKFWKEFIRTFGQCHYWRQLDSTEEIKDEKRWPGFSTIYHRVYFKQDGSMNKLKSRLDSAEVLKIDAFNVRLSLQNQNDLCPLSKNHERKLTSITVRVSITPLRTTIELDDIWKNSSSGLKSINIIRHLTHIDDHDFLRFNQTSKINMIDPKIHSNMLNKDKIKIDQPY